MNLHLVYDTETTGFPNWNQPSDSEGQPHLVQLAAHLVDLDSRSIVQTLDTVIRPEGWEIPEEVSKIHGITTEYATAVGVPEDKAVSFFASMWKGRPRIAHNESFDARIIRIALKRYFGMYEDVIERWKNSDAHCTAVLSTPVCNLPATEKMKAAGRHHAKTPNLGEAYKHFTGENLVGAHRAIVDVDACLQVWWALQDNKEE